MHKDYTQNIPTPEEICFGIEDIDSTIFANPYNETTPEEYIYRFEDTTKQMLDITTRKNRDYSGTEKAFNNFEMVEKLGICTTEEGILVRMVDKITRISNLIHQDALVVDEKIEDTLLDLANYSIILKIYRETSCK